MKNVNCDSNVRNKETYNSNLRDKQSAYGKCANNLSSRPNNISCRPNNILILCEQDNKFSKQDMLSEQDNNLSRQLKK